MNLLDLFASIKIDTSDFKKGLNDAAGMAGSFGGAIGSAVGTAAKVTGVALGAASAATLAFGKSAISTGIQFDASMANVAAISGATGEEFDLLREKAIEMGGLTKFSATEAADAMSYMAMAGWKTEDMLSGISGIMGLAAASGVDLARTSDIVTDALTAFKLTAKDSGRFADVLAIASSNANTNVDLMGETFKYVASVAGGFDLKVEDVAEAIGLMANSGIKASQAGTSLRSIITRLTTNAGASSKSLGALDVLTKTLGVDFYDAGGKIRPFNDILDEAREAFQKLGVAEQAEAAKKIAGQNALSGWMALMNAAPEDIDKLRTAIETASFPMGNFDDALLRSGDSLTAMQQRLEAIDISAEGFQSMLQEAAKNADEEHSRVELLTESLLANAKAGTTLEDVVNALGGDLDGLGEIMDSVSGAATSMADVHESSLAGSLTSLGSAMETLKIRIYDGLQPALSEIVNFGVESVRGLTAAFNADGLSGMMDALGPIIDNLIGMLMGGIPKIVGIGGQILGALVTGIINNLPALVTGTVEIISSLATQLVEAAPSMAEKGGELLDFFADGLSQALPQLAGTALTIISSLGSYLREKIPGIVTTAADLLIQFATFLTSPSTLSTLVTAAVDVVAGFVEGIIQAAPALAAGATNIISSLGSQLAEHGPDMIAKGGEILSSLIDGIMAALPVLAESAFNIISSLIGTLMENGPSIAEKGIEIITFLVNGIVEGLPLLVEKAGEIMQNFGQYMAENGSTLVGTGLTLIEGLSSSLRENAGKLVDSGIQMILSLAQGAADSLPEMIKHIPTIISNIAGIINDNVPKLIIAGGKVILTLANGIIKSIPTLIAEFPKIIKMIWDVWNAINWLSLGTKIITLISNGIKSLGAVIPDFLKNIAEKAGNFIHTFDWAGTGMKVIKFLFNGVNKVRSIFPDLVKSIVTKAADFVKSIDWLQLGKDVLDFIINGAKTLAEEAPKVLKDIWDAAKAKVLSIDWLKLGKDILNGIIGGITELGGSAVTAIMDVGRDMLNGIKGLFGIKSPSREFAWIGRMIDEGLAKGISDNADTAESEAEKLAKSVYSAVTQEAEKQIKYERLSLTEQLELWKTIQSKFSQDSEQWADAYDKIFDLEEQIAAEHARAIQDTYNELVSNVEWLVNRENLSLADQLTAYERIRDQFEAGTDEWRSADDKIFELRKSLVKEHYQTMADEADRAAKRQKLSLNEQLINWERIMGEFAEGSEEWTSAEEKAYDLRTQIVDDYVSAVKAAESEISSLLESYDKELESRTSSIANTWGLFDKAEVPEDANAKELEQSLRRQVYQIEKFYAQIEELEQRGVSSELVSEIRGMGPKALGEVNALLTMADRDLERYSSLYDEKWQISNRAATKELEELKAQTDGKIEEQLLSVRQKYEESAPALGQSFTDGLASGILSGMSVAVNAAVEVAEAVENAIREKTETHSPSRLFARIAEGWTDGLAEGWDRNIAEIRNQVQSDIDFSGVPVTTTAGMYGDYTVGNQPNMEAFQNAVIQALQGITITAQFGTERFDSMTVQATRRNTYLRNGR